MLYQKCVSSAFLACWSMPTMISTIISECMGIYFFMKTTSKIINTVKSLTSRLQTRHHSLKRWRKQLSVQRRSTIGFVEIWPRSKRCSISGWSQGVRPLRKNFVCCFPLIFVAFDCFTIFVCCFPSLYVWHARHKPCLWTPKTSASFRCLFHNLGIIAVFVQTYIRKMFLFAWAPACLHASLPHNLCLSSLVLILRSPEGSSFTSGIHGVE